MIKINKSQIINKSLWLIAFTKTGTITVSSNLYTEPRISVIENIMMKSYHGDRILLYQWLTTILKFKIGRQAPIGAFQQTLHLRFNVRFTQTFKLCENPLLSSLKSNPGLKSFICFSPCTEVALRSCSEGIKRVVRIVTYI